MYKYSLLIRITHRDAKCQRWTDWLKGHSGLNTAAPLFTSCTITPKDWCTYVCPMHIHLTVISLGNLIPSQNVGGCVHISHSLYSWFCDIYILSLSFAVLSTLPILILDNEQLWGKFKNICQKNISLIVFPLLLISLSKFRFTTLFYMFLGLMIMNVSQLPLCLVHGKMYRIYNLKWHMYQPVTVLHNYNLHQREEKLWPSGQGRLE